MSDQKPVSVIVTAGMNTMRRLVGSALSKWKQRNGNSLDQHSGVDDFVPKAFAFVDGDRILILRKPLGERNKITEGWDLPGGKLEADEKKRITRRPVNTKRKGERAYKRLLRDIQAYLQREVNEETGLYIGKMHKGWFSYHLERRTKADGSERRLHIAKFVVRLSKTEVDPSSPDQYDSNITLDDIKLNNDRKRAAPEHTEKYLIHPRQLNNIMKANRGKISPTSLQNMSVGQLELIFGCPRGENINDYLQKWSDFPDWMAEEIQIAYQQLKKLESRKDRSSFV